MAWLDQFASQHGEDSWLCDHWAELKLPDYGFFVEFGAGDGKTISNTWWLEKSRGWHGLLCEPHPDNIAKLKAPLGYDPDGQAITIRPNSILEPVAVGAPGTVELGCPADPYLSGTLRTLDAPQKVVRAERMIEVQSVPLSNLLEKHGIEGIDVISIDTEGTELAAWRTLNLKRWCPRVAIIELITWGLPDESQKIIDAMHFDGYQIVCRTHHNGIFVDGR